MLSTRRVILFSIATSLFAVLSFVLFKQDAQKLPDSSAEPQAIVITAPRLEKPKKVEAPAELSHPKHPKDTQDFLNFVENADSYEEVYKRPARFVVARRVDDMWIAQGDILVDPNTFVEGVGDDNGRLARLNSVEAWPGNRVPYRIDPTLDPGPVLAAIATMNKQTHVQFVQAQEEPDFVYFARAQTGFCLSNLGHIGGQQFIRIDPATCRLGSILHEMMHTLGFVHEHSRFDRDDFVNVHWTEIEEGAQNQFQMLTSDFSSPALGAFDFDSILLYPSDAASARGRPTLTKKDGSVFKANRAGLSEGDIEKINTFYPKIE